jgi:hypothetical protein
VDHMQNPGPLAGGTGARDCVAGKLNDPEITLDAQPLQVTKLMKRFNLNARTATAIAPLVFGEVAE